MKSSTERSMLKSTEIHIPSSKALRNTNNPWRKLGVFSFSRLECMVIGVYCSRKVFRLKGTKMNALVAYNRGRRDFSEAVEYGGYHYAKAKFIGRYRLPKYDEAYEKGFARAEKDWKEKMKRSIFEF